MALFTETADVSVRPARPEDVAALTDVQIDAWTQAHAEALGAEVLASLDVEAMRAQWAASVEAPAGQGFAVFVACERADVVGFAAVAPGTIVALEVTPVSQRSGHGSRLLSAAVDRLRADGSEEVSTWILAGDTAREQFFAGSGLGPAGRTRTLDTGSGEVTETRWAATL